MAIVRAADEVAFAFEVLVAVALSLSAETNDPVAAAIFVAFVLPGSVLSLAVTWSWGHP